jgi:hypothetical protein
VQHRTHPLWRLVSSHKTRVPLKWRAKTVEKETRSLILTRGPKRALVLTSVIPAIQEAEIRRLVVQSQPGQIVHETLSWKKKTKTTQSKVGGVVLVAQHLLCRCEALSSNLSGQVWQKQTPVDKQREPCSRPAPLPPHAASWVLIQRPHPSFR